MTTSAHHMTMARGSRDRIRNVCGEQTRPEEDRVGGLREACRVMIGWRRERVSRKNQHNNGRCRERTRHLSDSSFVSHPMKTLASFSSRGHSH
jgi:hypothetical protein